MLQAIARARRPASRAVSLARLYYSEPTSTQHQSLSESDTRQAWLFLGSVFPARFASWDPRYLLAQLRQEHILGQIRGILSGVHSYGFKLVSVEPYLKDGSVFVKFNYSSGSGEDVLPNIESAIRHHFEEKSGIPSLTLFPSASAWITRGKPWIEDLHRFPSPNLYVIFDGPDISEEAIYEAFRPFGYIGDISAPGPIPNTPYRGVSVHFRRFSYAIAARNVNQNTTIGKTRLRTFYNRPVDAHVVRDWITNHPRLSIPLLIFIFGTITYTIFDPIRTVAIEAKMGDWLDYRAFSVYKWLRRNTVDRFAFLGSTHEDEPDESWQQRQEAKDALENYLSDTPSSVAFLHGPQGSGKTRMVNKLLSELKRPTLMIDCAELTHTRSDSHLLSILAGQIGYWPSFPFLSNLNSVIDMATKGLIGQPAGLSATAPEQVKQMLDVALSALQKVGSRRSTPSMKDRIAEKVKPQPEPEAATEKGSGPPGQVSPQPPSKPQPKQEEEHGWIDSARETALKPVRLLLSSKENSSKKDSAPSPPPARKTSHRERNEEVAALPIVVIRNFAAPGVKEDVMDVFARWVAAVAEHKLAHVIVIGDNRESAKAIAKALPSKPLTTIALYDADGATALQFVKQRLREVHVDTEFTPDQIEYVERLGGRASDLASLIYKVRSGQTVEEAVNDIVNRGVSELRKNAFGDDAEDAKSLPWTREQAWAVLKALARANEVPYHDMLVNYPFKGDEGALRQMERSELVTIGTYEGLPSAIRPGKPVYRYVFAKLVNDPIFHATQEIAYNTKLIETAIATIQSSEEELVRLGSISADSSSWYNAKTATKQRAQYLLGKMRAAQDSLEELESVNVQLKKVLKRGS